jgi:hypothetical protein
MTKPKCDKLITGSEDRRAPPASNRRGLLAAPMSFAVAIRITFVYGRGRGSVRAAGQFPDHEAGGQFGGAKTLISHPASITLITLSGVARELREEIGLTDALIRISVGIENVEDLISEIAQGLEHV